MRAAAASVLVSVAFAMFAASTQAQPSLSDTFKAIQRENAAGSLAVLGLVGIPDDSAGAIFLESGESERDFSFKSAQLGGGFRWSEDVPLYLEGYVGYARYDPILKLRRSGETARLPLKWTSFAATAGIGREFDIAEYWKFRPLAHLSLGRTQSDASLGAQFLANQLGLDRDFARSGGIWAGGLGASATLSYDHRLESDHQKELQLRYTHIEYRPIGEDEDLLAESTASNAVLWSRYRFPTGWRLFNRPVRGVTDFSLSYLIGDQSEVLGTDWLGRVGIGGEIDLTETPIPWVSTTRFMLRYYGSDTVTGFTAGLGFSF